MIMAMIRPETEMKDSGVQWIGDIPTSWGKAKFKYFYINTNAGEVIDKNFWNKGKELLYTCQKTPMFSDFKGFPDAKRTNENDLLLTRNATPYIFVPEPKSIYSNVVQRVNINLQNDRRYLKYALMCGVDAEKVNGNTIPSWNMQVWNNIFIPLAELSEQQAIANYLDETCSKIDEIIVEAKASIDEYEKLRQATIDENILGYDSVHIKLRQLGSLKNGLNFSHSDDVANMKFLGVGCFKDNMILSEVADFADEHIDFEISEEYLLSNGDIVFVRSNGSKELVGRSIMVENIDYPVTFSGFCIRFRNMHTELVDNRFLLYYFRTTHFKQSLLKYSNDSTNINNLNQEMLNAIRINAPVIGEQKLLVKKLEEQVLMIDSLIAEKESLINDLEAYKKSLIYEVVTGKRRVV